MRPTARPRIGKPPQARVAAGARRLPKRFYTLPAALPPVFTGIVEGTGRVASVAAGRGGGRALRLTVELGPRAAGLRAGQSVALDGACLTVTRRMAGGRCAFDVIGQTARLTTLGRARRGDRLNVERSMRAGARVEGHFVLGHVDGTARVASAERRGEETVLALDVPARLARELPARASVAVNGVSMTVAARRGARVRVHVIPHTLRLTNLGALGAGDAVNVETDVLAKYTLARRLPK